LGHVTPESKGNREICEQNTNSFCFRLINFAIIKILGIIHCSVCHSKHDGSEIGYFLHLQVGPVERARLCLYTPATAPIGFTNPTIQTNSESFVGSMNLAGLVAGVRRQSRSFC
jgi:hypothetical protein